VNAALLAAAMLANSNATIAAALDDFRRNQTDCVLADSDPSK
jgi:phosphoribosylcarboxyaminoimidazole (NCAIR) mutase